MKFSFFIILILCCFQVSAFNWNKCKKVGTGTFFPLLSTSSYLSSTGGCAMIGNVDHDMKVFFAHNYDKIKVDIARGGGEYLHTFTDYFGCPQTSYVTIKFSLKSKFTDIYGEDSIKSTREAYERIEDIILNDFGIKKSCTT